MADISSPLHTRAILRWYRVRRYWRDERGLLRDLTDVAWMTVVGFAIGLLIPLLTPEHQATTYGGSASSYEPPPRRDAKVEPACPKGQDIASVTLAHGMIVGVTCAKVKPVER
jgi:hypothetical protein